MTYLIVSALVSLLVGTWVGKRLTVRKFHRLQDEGILVVLTADQFKNLNQLRGLLREELGAREPEDDDEEEAPYSEVNYRRRDSEERRDDWARSLKRDGTKRE